ncbi:MAG: ArsR family transcriptional regulator [Synergistaceae bacterium]|nr:ArsR family transcriptional regulator [Synergistaceae bacterium]
MKFFLNSDVSAHLRGLAEEFGESTNAVRVELNRLCAAGFLRELSADAGSGGNGAGGNGGGRKKSYCANPSHPLFPELQRIVRKVLGIDQLVDGIVERLGNVKLALVTGDYAHGIDSGIIDLTLVGDVDKQYLNTLVEKVENLIARKVRVLVLSPEEYEKLLGTLRPEESLFLWGDRESLAKASLAKENIAKENIAKENIVLENFALEPVKNAG